MNVIINLLGAVHKRRLLLGGRGESSQNRRSVTQGEGGSGQNRRLFDQQYWKWKKSRITHIFSKKYLLCFIKTIIHCNMSYKMLSFSKKNCFFRKICSKFFIRKTDVCFRGVGGCLAKTDETRQGGRGV